MLLFQQNQTELPIGVLWSPLAVVSAMTVALYLGLLLFVKDPPKAGAVAALAVVWFFYWAAFTSDLSGLHLGNGARMTMWSALIAAGIAALLRTRRSVATVGLGLVLLAAAQAAVPVVRIARWQSTHPGVRPTDRACGSARCPRRSCRPAPHGPTST